MMVRLAWLVVGVAMALNLSACGYRGKLKSPAQIEAEQAKKAHEAEKKKAADEKDKARADAKAKASPAPEPEDK